MSNVIAQMRLKMSHLPNIKILSSRARFHKGSLLILCFLQRISSSSLKRVSSIQCPSNTTFTCRSVLLTLPQIAILGKNNENQAIPVWKVCEQKTKQENLGLNSQER